MENLVKIQSPLGLRKAYWPPPLVQKKTYELVFILCRKRKRAALNLSPWSKFIKASQNSCSPEIVHARYDKHWSMQRRTHPKKETSTKNTIAKIFLFADFPARHRCQTIQSVRESQRPDPHRTINRGQAPPRTAGHLLSGFHSVQIW